KERHLLLGQLAVEGASDRYLLAGVLSSLNEGNFEEIVQVILAKSPKKGVSPWLLENLLQLSQAFKKPRMTAALLASVVDAEGKVGPERFIALAGFLDALGQQKSSLQKL